MNELEKCKDCGEGYIEERIIRIIEASCWKCNEAMKVARGSMGMSYGPEQFTEAELRLAADHGVLIVDNFAKTAQDSYKSNTCAKCKSFVGTFYLKDYFFASEAGQLKYVDIKTSVFDCDYCRFYSED